MKRSALVIVCNGEPFIKPQLDNLYNIVDEIVIIEGADDTLRKIIKSKTSTDDTIKTIKSYHDPDNKIKLFQGDFHNKVRMSATGCDNITGDLIYQVDVDEFANHDVIEKGFDILSKHDCALIPQRWYYKWGNTYLFGNDVYGSIDKPNRFFRNKKSDGLFISHIPRSGYRKFSDDKYIETESGTIDGFGHHFLSIFRWQLENKMKYYISRGDCGAEVLRTRMSEFDSIKENDINNKTVPSYYNKKLVIDNDLKFIFNSANYIKQI